MRDIPRLPKASLINGEMISYVLTILLSISSFSYASQIDDSNNNLFTKQNRQLKRNATTPWGGCVDPNNPHDIDANMVQIGKRTTICVIISKGGDWGDGMLYSRWVFQPTADEYTKFTISESYDDLVRNPNSFYYPQVSVHVESQQTLSFIRRYYDDTYYQSWIFPYLTGIITVQKGHITGITWDKSCMFCDAARCVENTYYFDGKNASNIGSTSKSCYFTKSECDNLVAAGEIDTCKLSIYFVWTGTDKNGRVFTSVGSRFGAFPQNRLPKIESFLPKFNIPVFGT